jgi:hypothetical protein
MTNIIKFADMRKCTSDNATAGEYTADRSHVCLDRYLEIVTRDMPSLALNEWTALADSLNSTVRDKWVIANLEIHVQDSIDMEGLADRWEFDGDSLCKWLSTMTFGQKVAIVEVIDRSWSNYGGKSCDPAEAFEAVGAKIIH